MKIGQRVGRHRWFGELPPGQRDTWLFLSCVSMGWLAPPFVLQREFNALAAEAGSWDTRESASRMSSAFRRAEAAARGEKQEWQGRLVDPRYRFLTATMVGWLSISDQEMRAANLRLLISPDVNRERKRAWWHQRREAEGGQARAGWLAEHAIERNRPWDAEGISRRTWYRRQAAGQAE